MAGAVIWGLRRRSLVGLVAACAAFFGGTAAATAAEAPPIGASLSDVDLRSVPGAVPYGLGHAIPLEGRRPDWYTPELRERVLAAEGQPVQAPPDAPLPGAVGIRPGAWMLDPAGCTMNFVFTSGTELGIGTAGHCVEVGDEVVLLTLALGGEPVLVNIGTTVVSQDNDIGDDFGLVAIRPELNEWVFPTIAVIGGPCGQYFGSGPETVWHYGHGLAVGTGGTPRAGIALNWQTDGYAWDGLATPGDSGSPVRVTGLQAAGNLTHLVVDSEWLPGFIAGTRIGKIEQINGGWTMVNSGSCAGLGGGGDGGGGTTPGGGDTTEPGNGNGGGKDKTTSPGNGKGNGRGGPPA